MADKSKNLIRVLGASMVADGLLLVAFGRRYIRIWQFGSRENPYRKGIDWLAGRPSWLLRGLGLAEAGLGLALLGRAPVEPSLLYRIIAGFYDAIDPDWRDWFYRDGHRAFDRAMATHLPPGGRVLDLGCGIGANLARLVDMELDVEVYVGVDLSEAMLARARRHFGDRQEVTFEQLDLEADPLPEGPFDLVVSTWVFEHLEDPVHVVEKAWEQLRPGGHAVLLFEIATGSLLDRFWDYVYRAFNARRIPGAVYERFPGRMAFDQFSGVLGELALIVLHKPIKE